MTKRPRISSEQKKKAEILLIVPPSPSVYSRMLNQWIAASNPLGIGYITSVLRKDGFKVMPLNLYLGLNDLKSLEYLIKQTKPIIVGFSTMTENFQNGILLAKFIKKVHPDAIIIFGGPHVTFMDNETLSNYDCVDIIVRREGEYAMLELANYFVRGVGALDDIRSITYKSNGKIVRTSVRPLINDLDKLPFPYREIFDLDGILSPARAGEVRKMIITSRGCPGGCRFCAASALAGGKYRMRSLDNIANEIMNIRLKESEPIFLGDDTISVNIPRLLALCSFLKKENIGWSGECRVDMMTKELAKILANSGCKGLQFGVESGSQNLLDSMGKDITLKQVKQAVTWATEAGISVICSMMIGLPEDTVDTIKQTVNYAEELQKKYKVGVVLGTTVPYPGTYYFNHAKELGLIIATKDYNQYTTINPITDTPNLSRWQIRNAHFDAVDRLVKTLPVEFQILFTKTVADTLAKEGYDILPLTKSTFTIYAL